MPNDRPNTEVAQIVEDGLRLLRDGGAQVAANFMLEHGVRVSVIGRVLAESESVRPAGAIVPRAGPAPAA